MPTIEDGTRRKSGFKPEAFAEGEETVVVIDRTGAEVAVEDASEGGVILRGEDADKYLAGEPVAVSGVGWVTADGGFSHAKPEEEPAPPARSARPDNELPETPEPKKSGAKPDDK